MKKALNILVIAIIALSILASCNPETPVKPTTEEAARIVNLLADFTESLTAILTDWEISGDSCILKNDYPCMNGDTVHAGASMIISGSQETISLTADLTGDGTHTLVISGSVDGSSVSSLRLDGKLIDPTGIDFDVPEFSM